jgi:hypothetical protein
MVPVSLTGTRASLPKMEVNTELATAVSLVNYF